MSESKKSKNSQIQIRIDNEFKNSLQVVADHHGYTLSSLITVLLKEWYNTHKPKA